MEKNINELTLIEVESLLWRQEMQIRQAQQNIKGLSERREVLVKQEQERVAVLEKAKQPKQAEVVDAKRTNKK